METNGHGGRGSSSCTHRVRRLDGNVVGLGCEVLIRSIRSEGEIAVVLPAGLRGDSPEQIVVIAEEMGVYQLTARTPLGQALLGHRPGDVVSVRVQAGTVLYEILAIDPPMSSMDTDARVAELADAALLKGALLPAEGPGSSPGAGTTLDRVERQLEHGREARSCAGVNGRNRPPSAVEVIVVLAIASAAALAVLVALGLVGPRS